MRPWTRLQPEMANKSIYGMLESFGDRLDRIEEALVWAYRYFRTRSRFAKLRSPTGNDYEIL